MSTGSGPADHGGPLPTPDLDAMFPRMTTTRYRTIVRMPTPWDAETPEEVFLGDRRQMSDDLRNREIDRLVGPKARAEIDAAILDVEAEVARRMMFGIPSDPRP